MRFAVELFGAPFFSFSIGPDGASALELIQQAGGDFQVAPDRLPFGFHVPEEDDE